MSGDLKALEARIGRLEDRNAVVDVVLRIAAGVDRHDVAALQSAIWPDAHIDMGGAPITGAVFAAALAPPPVPSTGRMHLTGNHQIRVEGDRARCESYVISAQEVTVADGAETRLRAGRYLDRFERRDGEWRLSRRVFVDEWSRLDGIGQQPKVGTRRGRPAPDDARYAEFILGTDAT